MVKLGDACDVNNEHLGWYKDTITCMERCDFTPSVCGVSLCVILAFLFLLWPGEQQEVGFCLGMGVGEEMIYKSWSKPAVKADKVGSKDWTRNSPFAELKGNMGRNQKALRIQKQWPLTE